MPDTSRLRDQFAIAGIGLSRFGKLPGTSAMGFCLEAAKHAIDDCGIPRDDLDGVLVAFPSSQGEAHGWASRAAAFLGITPAFCTTMDMGGATAIGMLQTAVALLEAGMCRAVLCAFGTQNSPQGMMPTLFGSPWAIPYGDVGAITFMGHLMRRQMHEHGLTGIDYAHIAVTWRTHAANNPHAQMRKPMTIEDHQRSRFVNEPMRLFDCCLFTDGGGAFVVTSRERARDLRQVPALVSGVGQVHSSEVIHPYDTGHGSGREAGERTYAMAGCGPADVDVCQIYDAFTPRVVHDLVAYGFCTWEEVGEFIRSGQIGLGGRLPCNTAGGLISEGHLQGMGHVAEAVRQLRGTSYNQVPNVTLSMCTGYGGAPHEPPPTVAYSAAILREAVMRGIYRDVIADGIRLRVLDAGQGPTLLLLHGLSASHEIWEHVVDEFADRYRVIAPDLPGHGESAKPDAPYTIDFYAGVVRTLARELDIDGAIVGGTSLGGKIALELACWYPRFVQALVLSAPAGEYARGLRPFGKAIQALSRPTVMRLALERALEQSFHDRTRIGHVTRRRILGARLAAPDFADFARAIARSVGGVLAAEAQPLDRVTQPVLAVWGREDRIVPVYRSHVLARAIPHARLRFVDQCGHIAMLEQPGEFNRHVGEFLASLAAGAVLAAEMP